MMLSFSLDIRTIILLIFVGNVASVAILFAYKREGGLGRAYRFFLAGRILQSIAWGLLALRGEIPDLFSAYIGNTLLFFGVALETIAITVRERADRRLETIYILLALFGTIVFWSFAETQELKVVIASITVSLLFGTVAVVMIRAPVLSRLGLMLASLYGLISIALLFRADTALLSPGSMGLLTWAPVQGMSFFTMFLIMLLGTVGFLLLLKEQEDLQLRKALRELASREALITNIFDTSSVSICLVDSEGRIKMANQRMAEMFNSTLDQLIGDHYVNWIAPDQRQIAQRRIDALLDNSLPSLQIEREYTRNDGTSFWGQLTCTRMYDPESEKYQLVGVIVDITDRKRAEDQIREMAQHDVLTGLANRALFSDRFRHELEIAQREKTRFALLFIDLDKFKFVNDSHGHAMGDLLLQEVAQRITSCVRHSDTVARIGGDEFVVLLHSIDTGPRVLEVAEKIRHALSEPCTIDTNTVSISASIGVSIYPDHGTIELELAKHADSAMFEAKNQGRDKVCLAELR